MYDAAIILHNCEAWDNDVMDPKKTNQVFELPVAAVAKDVIKPRKENDAPISYYPQDRTCGISLFSSAFHYMFDKNLAAKIHSNKQGYIEYVSEPGQKKNKKVSSLKFLNSIMMKKEFRNYYVHRKKKLIFWKDIYYSNDCYENIFLCIIKSNVFS